MKPSILRASTQGIAFESFAVAGGGEGTRHEHYEGPSAQRNEDAAGRYNGGGAPYQGTPGWIFVVRGPNEYEGRSLRSPAAIRS